MMSAIQEVLTKYPGVRIESNLTKGDVLVLGTPAAHAVIRETLAGLRRKVAEAHGFDGSSP